MNETNPTISEFRADHRHWKSEHGIWRQEVRLWEEDCKAALLILGEMRQLVQQQDEALQKHFKLINSHEASLELHERALSDSEIHAGSQLPRHQASLRSHQQQGIKHLEYHDAHERLKQKHHELTVRLQVLADSCRMPAESNDP